MIVQPFRKLAIHGDAALFDYRACSGIDEAKRAKSRALSGDNVRSVMARESLSHLAADAIADANEKNDYLFGHRLDTHGSDAAICIPKKVLVNSRVGRQLWMKRGRQDAPLPNKDGMPGVFGEYLYARPC